jgi:hypothetical protein
MIDSKLCRDFQMSDSVVQNQMFCGKSGGTHNIFIFDLKHKEKTIMLRIHLLNKFPHKYGLHLEKPCRYYIRGGKV